MKHVSWKISYQTSFDIKLENMPGSRQQEMSAIGQLHCCSLGSNIKPIFCSVTFKVVEHHISGRISDLGPHLLTVCSEHWSAPA